MISKVSVLLSERIGGNLNSSDNEKAVYAYGIEVLLSLLTNLIILSILAYIMNKKWELLIYLLFFSILRSFTGGYHAKTHVGCIFITSFVFVISAMCGMYLDKYEKIFLVLGVIFSVFIVFWRAPCESGNKPLSKSEKKKYRKISRILVIIFSAFTISLYFFREKTNNIYITATAVMVFESASMLKK